MNRFDEEKDFSQHGEQQVILDFFKLRYPPEDFSFLDIGAFDGVTFSNTAALVQKGWKGYLVEGSPVNFTSLYNNISDHTSFKSGKVVLINALIMMQTGLVPFWQGDAVSSANDEHRKIWADHLSNQHFLCPAIQISKLSMYLPDRFNFINIDVEGGSAKLFQEVCQYFQFDLICVEHDNELDYCQHVADRYNLIEIHRNGVNVIYGK